MAEENSDFIDNKVQLNAINTNARSLRPKISSFIQCFVNLSLTLAIVSETWLSDKQFELESENLLLGNGLRLHSLSRPPLLSGASYGGVAVVVRESCTRSRRLDFPNPEGFEVLPVCITHQDLLQKIFAIACYIPPNYTVPKGKQCMQHISDIVLHIMNSNSDPLIIVGGDFNQWKIGEVLAEYSELLELSTPPTRGERHIDKIFTNWPEYIEDGGCIPPLKTEEMNGQVTYSDHEIQYLVSRLPRKEPVRWESFTFRPYTTEGERGFLSDLEQQDWAPLLARDGPNAKVGLFHSILEDLVERHFPLRTVRRKDGDLPWFDYRARKMVKKKAAIYRSEGASGRWSALRDKLETYLEARRVNYLEKQREKFTGPGASANFYRNVKAFGTAEKPKAFDVRSLCPGLSDKEVADEIADYFNKISREFSPLMPDQVPATYHRQLDLLTVDKVEKMLRSAKKPRSTVRGDIPPPLVNPAAPYLRTPVTDIFNAIILSNVWPIAWKREYVTVIPKKTIPESLSDLRNISCTPLLSKIFESHILSRLEEEISLKPNQYGGVKKCSTTHMVVELLQEICENAEDYRSVTALTAIDYSKAFNRVSYQHCLEAFRKKGTSTPLLRIIASFLTNRTMCVRVGQEWSDPLDVDGGCPQGSVLGVRLFNTATDDLEDDFLKIERERLRLPGRDERPPSPPSRAPVEGDRPTTTSTPSKPLPLPPVDLSPVSAGAYASSDPDVKFKPALHYTGGQPVLHEPPRETSVGTQVLTEKQVRIFKYIDDNIICEKVNLGNIPIVNGPPPMKTKHIIPTQNAFRSMTGNASSRGMVVNTAKTNHVCVSDALKYTPNTFFEDEAGVRIESGDSMKVLGFHFSNKPTVQLHIAKTVKKIRQRYHSLRHLARYGMNRSELIEVYKGTILPLADYCAPAYHAMMTDQQDQCLEAAQTGALRAIFGYGLSARKLRDAAGVKTLRARRIEQTDKFALKAAADPRFCHWFPKVSGRRSARNTEIYEEKFAKCERLKNSPIYYMRRRLNGKEGKVYGERNKQYRENFDLE